VTKYDQPSFSVHLGSKKYRDNYDRVFGKFFVRYIVDGKESTYGPGSLDECESFARGICADEVHIEAAE
jgi:hypothetical protein